MSKTTQQKKKERARKKNCSWQQKENRLWNIY